MSRLDDLIDEFCPNGVEYIKLGEITQILRGTRLTKSQLFDDGKYAVFHGGLDPLGRFVECNRTSNTVMIINVGASAGTVGFCFDDFWSSDGCYCIAKSNAFVDRFIYFVLVSKEDILRSKVRFAGIPTLDSKIIEEMSIPLPPLAIQEEIVRILDKFTALEAELEAELEARKKQYEHYRRNLLIQDSHNMTEPVMNFILSDVAHYSKTRISASRVDINNYIGVDNLLPNKGGKVKSSYVPTEGNLTKYEMNDVLIGNIRPYLQKIWLADNAGGTNGDVLPIRVNDAAADLLSAKFLFYLLSSDDFFHYDMQHAKGAKMPRGDKTAIMQYPIQIPPLPEQERIVGILDRFDTLVNDISQGIPAEIAARRKQYEYYRNKLLTFKEKTS